MTNKESVAVLDPKSAAPRAGRRSDAVGAEVPVTVHASRTTQGLGKNLPAVHEDTRTVIVLQQGAVVRLTASLTPGETVVLTNRANGADVLCRVGNVKSQPGIQHYVDLEFIQRAPGFWGEAAASASAQSVAVPEAPAAAPTLIAQPAALAPPPVPVPLPPVVAMPAPVIDLHAAAQTLQPAPLADSVDAPWNTPQANPVRAIRPPLPSRGSADSTFASLGAGIAGSTSWGSQKGLLITAASALLAAGVALGGYWSSGHKSAVPPAPQQAMNVPQVQVPDPIKANPAVIDTTAATLYVAPAVQTDITIESRLAAETPANRVQPPTPAARTLAAAARRNNAPIGEMKAPKAKQNRARADSSEAPPMLIGAVGSLGDAGAANALLVDASTGPAPPPGSSRPAIGGQLQPPQLIASIPPVYPVAAREQSLQGVVVLDVLVDETGKVVETKVIAGPQMLVTAAQESLRSWKYRPAQLNGHPIPVHTKVSVRFSLH
jgi:TonB family protein